MRLPLPGGNRLWPQPNISRRRHRANAQKPTRTPARPATPGTSLGTHDSDHDTGTGPPQVRTLPYLARPGPPAMQLRRPAGMEDQSAQQPREHRRHHHRCRFHRRGLAGSARSRMTERSSRQFSEDDIRSTRLVCRTKDETAAAIQRMNELEDDGRLLDSSISTRLPAAPNIIEMEWIDD